MSMRMRGISERVRAQCQLIAEHARLVTGSPRAHLLVYDDTNRQLVTVAAPGSDIPLQQIALDLVRRNYPGLDPLDLSYPATVNSVVSAAFVGQRTQVSKMEEAFANIMPTPVSVIARGLIGITHVVSTPISAEGRALGLIRFLVASAPTDSQQALMEAAASQIGLTLANAELAEQARRQLAATRAIGEVARLGASAGLEPTLDALATRVRDLTEADAAVVYLTNGDGETFAAAAESLSESGKAAEIGRMTTTPTRKIGIGLVGWVIAAGEAAFVPDLRRDPRTQTLHVFTPEAAIAVPMRLAGETLGCLRISVLGARQFTESDLWLAQTLADEAAVAVQHARELQRAQEMALDAGVRETARRAHKQITRALHDLLHGGGDVDGLPESEVRARLSAAQRAAEQLEAAYRKLVEGDPEDDEAAVAR